MDYTMITAIWFFQIILASTSSVFSTELLPERYLKPQDFNYHPFTDVGIPASLKKALKPTNLYAILSKKRPREGREFPPQNVVIYPTPHPSVTSRKYLETNEIGKYDDPYANVPKNYAFSYIVKDQYSGDDFSHSQAHNGKATRGQYRVKLPDGRTQIVNYTADHKGYRADVQYEQDLLPKSISNHKLPTVQQSYQTNFISGQHIPLKSSPQVVYAVTPSPPSYLPSSTADSPVQYLAGNTPLKLMLKPTAVPAQYKPEYVAGSTPLKLVLKPTAVPVQYQPEYVATTAAPYIQQQFVTSTAAPHYVAQEAVSSTPLYPAAHDPGSAVPYHHGQYQTYQAISSSVSPEHPVIVTPRPTYNRAVRKNEPQQSAPLYYRLL